MQNKHIEHPEDTILTGDLSCLDCLLNPGHLSVKIDGAPAIVWGTNPATGKFFVGTKSVFNKVKIKINESHADIDQNHVGEVATILHHCFDWLPDADGIFQGDFIGFGGSDEYTPNTITYKFDEVIDQNIIIAPHTYYTAESDLRDAIAHPMKFIITDTPYCRFVFPKAYIWSGNYQSGLNQFEIPPVLNLIRELIPSVQFVSAKEARQIQKNVNTCIREDVAFSAEDFFGNESLMLLYGLVMSLKEDLLHECRNVGPAAYIGQERISAEGYVYSNEFGTFKLVNREVFSYHNFTQGRFQCTT